MSQWEQFIDGLRDQAGVLAKDELKQLIRNGRQDSDAFVRAQADDLTRYLNQLAGGEITRGEFESNVSDLQVLTRMQLAKLTVTARASAQRLVEGIQNLIFDGLLKLVL